MKTRKALALVALSVAILMLFVTQAFGAVTFLENPDAAYLARTTKLDLTALTGSGITQVATPEQTITFSSGLNKAQVGVTWMTWNVPPYVESASPALLISNVSDLTMNLSKPVKEFGLEIEPSAFAVENFVTYFKLSSNGEAVAIVPRSVDGDAGARLFSVRSDVAFDRIEIVDQSSNAFAIGQLRYAFGTRTITYAAGAGGSITGSASQTVAYGASCTPVTAVPAAGYAFSSWSDGVTSATRTDSALTVDKGVTASFVKVIPKASVVRTPNKSTVTYKRKKGVAKYTLSATMTGWGGVALAKRTVYLQTSTNGKKWKSTYKLTTNASGKASKSFKIKSKQVRYVRWYVPAGSGANLATYSAKTKVTVK